MQFTTLLDQIHQGASTSWPTLPSTAPDLIGATGPDTAVPMPCQQHQDADLWFAERTADVEHAKSLCRTCPVRESCLAGALDRAEPWGVWGGEVFVDGAVVARKRGRGRPRKNESAA